MRAPNDSVLTWLLDSDPSIRWQAMRDLTKASEAELTAERARVAETGWGAQLLSMQAADGRWGGATWNKGWNSTMHVLMLLRDMGLDPESEQAKQALERVKQITWRGCGPPECDENPFFEGELEPCINGQVAAVGAYFKQDVSSIIERLLNEQLADGGWNCGAPHKSQRSSFNTTICVLEALLAYEQTVSDHSKVMEARLRGEAYLLDRQLFKRLSTGEIIRRNRKGKASITDLAFPTWWQYDLLRALDYFRSTDAKPNERLADAIDLVLSKRDEGGRWVLEARHEGTMPLEFNETVGKASKWITLRALRVMKWFAG